MGLDISFFGEDPQAAEIDGQRLASVPGFLNFVLVLGDVLRALKSDPQDRARQGSYETCVAYVNTHPEAKARFEEYLGFVTDFAARIALDGARLEAPLDVGAYDPTAGSLSAALMLRDDPITSVEARAIAEMLSELLRHTKTMARLRGLASKWNTSSIEWMIEVFERFKRCIDVAAEKNLSFKIDF